MEAMNHLEKEILIRWFEYHMPMDQRVQLMRELPQIYNKLSGSKIVYVTTAPSPKQTII